MVKFQHQFLTTKNCCCRTTQAVLWTGERTNVCFMTCRSVAGALRGLHSAQVATDKEVQAFIDHHKLSGVGIGYVDAHLLAGTLLSVGAKLWTRDKRLRNAALRLGLEAAQDQ